MKYYELIFFLFIIILILFLIGCPSKPAPKPEPQPPIPEPQPEPEPPDPNATNPYIYIQAGKFYFQGKEFAFKGINYYPSQRSWRKMWTDWYPELIEKELDLLQGIGINVVRIFLDYNEFEKQRERTGEWSIMLARLDELLLYIDKRGMRALPTFFVWGRSGKIGQDQAHIAHIIKRFREDPRIFGWDISNELDHGWINKPSARAEIQFWATAMSKYLKSIDPNHITTVGDFGHYLGNREDWQGTGISLDASKMSVPAELQDFVCFHWYSHHKALDIALQKLSSLGKPIIVEEIGMPTDGKTEDGKNWPLAENQVANYYRAWILTAYKRAYLMPWCGFDYDPAFAPFSPDSVELFFGLFDRNYRIKLTGEAFRDDFMKASLFYGGKPLQLPAFPSLKRKIF